MTQRATRRPPTAPRIVEPHPRSENQPAMNAFIAGWFSERGWGSTLLGAVGGRLVALCVIYLGGWSWLSAFAGAKSAWLGGVRPFILADILKVAFGASLLPQLQRVVTKILQP